MPHTHAAGYVAGGVRSNPAWWPWQLGPLVSACFSPLRYETDSFVGNRCGEREDPAAPVYGPSVAGHSSDLGTSFMRAVFGSLGTQKPTQTKASEQLFRSKSGNNPSPPSFRQRECSEGSLICEM